MQSKTSFFNKTLYVKNLKRFWPLWALSTLVLCIGPISTMISSRSLLVYGYTRVEPQTALVNITTHFVPVYALIMSCLTAMCVWNYLFNRRSAYSIHALPCTRNELFVTNFISGLSLTLIPGIIAGILEVCAITNAYGFSVYGTVALFGIGIVETIYFFSFATLIAMVVGHIVALPGVYFLFNFIFVLIESEFNYIIRGYCPGVCEFNQETLGILTPAIWLFENDHNEYIGDVRITTIDNIPKVLSLLVVSLAILALSMFIYNKKEIERAGQAISVKVLNPIILSIVTVVGTIGGGAIFTYIFESDDAEKLFNIMPLEILFMAISAFVTFFLGLVISKGTVKVFNAKNFKIFGCVLAGVVAINLFTYLDVFKLTTRVPDAIDVASVTINAEYNGQYSFESEEQIEKITDLHKAMASEARNRNRYYQGFSASSYAYDDDYVQRDYSDTISSYLTITYYLKNGRSFTRQYSGYRLNVDEVNTPDSIEYKFNRMITSKEMIMASLHINDSNYALREIYVNTYSNKDLGVVDRVNYSKIVNALLDDAEEGNLSMYHWAQDNDYYVDITASFYINATGYYGSSASFWLTSDNKNVINELIKEGVLTEDFLKESMAANKKNKN